MATQPKQVFMVTFTHRAVDQQLIFSHNPTATDILQGLTEANAFYTDHMHTNEVFRAAAEYLEQKKDVAVSLASGWFRLLPNDVTISCRSMDFFINSKD